MISFEELIREVSSIKVSSDQLASMVISAGNGLSANATNISMLVRGSRTGMDAVMGLNVASRSLNEAATSIRTLSKTCNECVAHLAK